MKTHSILFLFTISLLIHITGFAQKRAQAKVDSLENILEIAKKDTNSYLEISKYHSNQNDFPKALEHLQNAVSVAREQNNKMQIGKCLTLMAELYLKQDETAQSLINLEKALFIFKELRDTSWTAVTLMRMGECYGKLHNTSKATECYNQSLTLLEKIKAKNNLTFVYNSMGIIYCL